MVGEIGWVYCFLGILVDICSVLLSDFSSLGVERFRFYCLAFLFGSLILDRVIEWGLEKFYVKKVKELRVFGFDLEEGGYLEGRNIINGVGNF